MGWLKSSVKQKLLVTAGTVSLSLGVIGIFVPVMPTTPFLLLAAICYLRGSQRLYQWLLSHRVLGAYIRNYLEGRGMSLKNKIWTLSLLWVTVLCTAVFLVDSLVVRAILGAVVVGVTIHILSVKTLKNG